MPVEPNQFRQAIIENTLRSCQLFMGLPAEDIVAIASFIISKHLDKGNTFSAKAIAAKVSTLCKRARSTCIA